MSDLSNPKRLRPIPTAAADDADATDGDVIEGGGWVETAEDDGWAETDMDGNPVSETEVDASTYLACLRDEDDTRVRDEVRISLGTAMAAAGLLRHLLPRLDDHREPVTQHVATRLAETLDAAVAPLIPLSPEDTIL